MSKSVLGWWQVFKKDPVCKTFPSLLKLEALARQCLTPFIDKMNCPCRSIRGIASRIAFKPGTANALGDVHGTGEHAGPGLSFFEVPYQGTDFDVG